MRLMVPVCLALMAISSVGQAQSSKEDLMKDLVTVRDAKMVYEAYGIVKLTLPGYEPVQFQTKSYSEVPATGVMSRDNFVAITTAVEALILMSGFAESYQVSASQFLEGYDFTDLEAPIGTPDYELNLYMTAEGLQFEFVVTATGQTSRQTMTWEEMFEQ